MVLKSLSCHHPKPERPSKTMMKTRRKKMINLTSKVKRVLSQRRRRAKRERKGPRKRKRARKRRRKAKKRKRRSQRKRKKKMRKMSREVVARK
jgi:hypothetical protein